MSFSQRMACLLFLACVAIFPIALAAQDSNGQAPKPSSSTAQTRTAPEQQQELPSDLPAWAYGFDNTKEARRADRPDSDARGGPDNGVLRHLPGSKFSFSLTQIRDNSGPADWYPEDHPQMPDITALARGFPGANIIVGHCGGPLGYGRYAGKRDEVFADWKRSVTELAKCRNVTMKLGGMMMRLAAYDYMALDAPPRQRASVAINTTSPIQLACARDDIGMAMMLPHWMESNTSYPIPSSPGSSGRPT